MKALVLTRSMGEGHNRAALALQEAFEARGHTCEVTDALRLVSTRESSMAETTTDHQPRLRHRLGADLASTAYGWAAFKAPALFGAVYGAGDLWTRTPIPSPIYLQNRKHAEATWAYIDEHGFDVVASTHTFPMETMSAVRKRFPSPVRYYSILTDYTCTPFFAEPRLDGYFISHPDLIAECVRAGLPSERTFADGLPVSRRFQNRLAKADARKSLGLPADVPIVMMMSGGVGSMYTAEASEQILADGGEDIHVVILTGRRTDLYNVMSKRYRVDRRVRVVPFTEKVAQYMAATDVLMSKPGGVSSTEAAVFTVPLVHTAAIPGCEIKNGRFFASHGMSLYNQRAGEAARLALWLLEDQDKVEAMKTHQREVLNPNAGDDIVARIESHL